MKTCEDVDKCMFAKQTRYMELKLTGITYEQDIHNSRMQRPRFLTDLSFTNACANSSSLPGQSDPRTPRLRTSDVFTNISPYVPYDGVFVSMLETRAA